ncbi:peroxisomal biogenesis factor 3-like [Dysidea avara]|uniref:peroxisomal biogenesis factor 3-like n=1 Tax=Dysidea avara TaxID=196820 RepID=UPI003327706C
MVFSGLCSFCKRHKWKLATVSIVCTGGYVGYKCLRGWLEKYRDEQTTAQMESLRMLQSFETNMSTCNNMIISLLQEVRSAVNEQLNSKKITASLKSKPTNKVELWNELKIISFAQYLVVGYACSMLVVFLRVQMSILGGVMCHNNDSEIDPVISEDTEKKFLSIAQYNVTKGIAKFIEVAKRVVVSETDRYSLKHSLSHNELCGLLGTLQKQLLTSLLTIVDSSSSDDEQDMTPLINFMIDKDKATTTPTAEPQYQMLMDVTLDILESKECQYILKHTINGSFSQLSSIMTNGFLSASQSLSTANVPVARVIPLLSDVAHSVLGDNVVESYMVQELLSHNQLRLLSYNIFEAVAN